MGGEMQDTSWPQRTFRFAVEIAGVGTRLLFTEVTGLDVQTTPIEYRAATSPTLRTVRMPTLQKLGYVTLKRGTVTMNVTLFNWLIAGINRDAVQRATVTIKLLDERGNPTMTWTLANVRPTKIAAPDLSATGNDVAIESLELEHEGLSIAAT